MFQYLIKYLIALILVLSSKSLLAEMVAGMALQSAGKPMLVGAQLPESITLASVLDYALEHNHDIRLARTAIEHQEGIFIETRSHTRPVLAAGASYTELDEGLSERLFPPSPNDWGFSLRVSQPVYAGGVLKADLKGRQAQLESSLCALEAVINNVVLEVKVRYFDVLLERDRIQVEEENVRLLEQQLSDERDRYEAGNVSQFEVLRAEVLLATAQPDLIRARNRFIVAGDRLRQVVGFDSYGMARRYESEMPHLTETLSYNPASYDLQTSLESAHRQRPELKQLQLLVEAGEYGIRGAMGGIRPRVDVFAAYSLRKSSDSVQFSNSLDGWSLGLEGSWNIFDSGRTKGRVQQARSALEGANIRLDQQRLAIEVELREAWSAWREAEQLVSAAERVVEQAREALRLARARYTAGAATQLDVLESQVSLTEANTQQLEAFYSHMVAVARMQKAMGQ